jgi:TolB-like protein/AraC-like DNA-binding protein
MNEPLSRDQIFIRKLTEVVLANLSEENFNVSMLANKTGMSRSVIHRRLKTLKDQNVSQFIREIRLRKAMEMLQHNLGTASEVAYKVGFSSPTYFNKCFHEYFGYPPGEVKKRIVPEEEEADRSVMAEEIRFQHSPDEVVKPQRVFGRKRRMVILLSSLTIVILVLALGLFNHYANGNDIWAGYGNRNKDLSIVVLPFKNLSEDPNNKYFADGIMEDILNNLYAISDLRVISRTTSESFSETGLTAREIARKVNASNVLEGSIRRYGDKARISVQLIDAHRDQHLWSANFDREFTDIIGIQGDIAQQVALKLKAVITDKEMSQIGKVPTHNSEAYDYYLKGRFLLHKANSEQRSDFEQEGVKGSIKYFEKAIAADSNFADAYAGLANAWFNLSAWGIITGYEGFIRAKDLSRKALEIDPDCAEAHAVLGVYLVTFERKFEEGRKELITSIKLNPNFSTAHQWYAQLLMITGPIEEARKQMNLAVENEPYFWVVQNLNAWVYYFEGKHRKAIEACINARDLKPDFYENNWLLFLNYAKLGEGEKAAKELQSIASLYPAAFGYPDEIWAAYKQSGIKGLFSWLADINAHRPIPIEGMDGHPFFSAWWNAILGNKEVSIYWLKKNMESEHRLYVYLNLIATNPDFDILRNDPRFLSIIEEIGLTPYNTRKPK